MKRSTYAILGGLLVTACSFAVLMKFACYDVDATPNGDKLALIAISSVNQTHPSEYNKSIAFYEYLLDEGFESENILYYAPCFISYIDGIANLSNIADGFEFISENSTEEKEVVIYISDHLQHSEYSYFIFEDGTINFSQIQTGLNNMVFSEMTFIVNGNKSGLAEDFRGPDRVIISSMASHEEICPDEFNITRSLLNPSADTDNNGIVSFIEAFEKEKIILENPASNQHPQMWEN